MIKPVVRVRALSPYRVMSVLAVLMLLVLPSLVAASPAGDSPPLGDLGDAPDRTNHAGAALTAYPGGAPANFPTVYDSAPGSPPGPFHHNPGADSWLGAAISAEQDADQMPDADGMTNIITWSTADDDGLDDGLDPPANPNGINLPQCQQTDFNYIVTGTATVITHTARVNVWFDFNRDGDWADTLQCQTPAGGVVNVREWAVQNQVVPVVPGSYTRTTTPFRSVHPTGNCPLWMRITLSEQPAPSVGGVADGRGPAGGYLSGETEDYYMVRQQGGCAGPYSRGYYS